MERHVRTRYTTEDALQYILAPGSDSELSELDDSDTEPTNPTQELDLILKEKSDSDHLIEPEDIPEVDSSTSTKRDLPQIRDHVFRWINKVPPATNISFKKDFPSPVPESVDQYTPLTYFKLFFGDEIIQTLAEQTNLYSMQQCGHTVNTTKEEIEQLIGMQMQMSVVLQPNYTMYWSADTRYPPIADVMPINRYKKLRRFLHANDNTYRNDEGNRNNKLFKIEPVLQHVRENCKKIEPEENQSIDEQIIPAKTRYSGIRQYNPKKPTKWGFKNFVRAGQSGFIYDFFLYTGANSGAQKCTGEFVVLKLCESLPRDANYKLFFDNWFCSLSLCCQLKEMGFHATATIRADRLRNCPLSSEKELKELGRGSSCYKTDGNSGLVALRWYDNKCIQLVSTYSNPKSFSTVQRWNRKEKRYVDVTCPNMVKEYNSCMGGVDLADMLIALYRTDIKTKRWYLKVLFHCVDIAKVNAWLIYRRYCGQRNVPVKQQLTLVKFTLSIASALVSCGKLRDRPVGRPPKRSLSNEGKCPPKRKLPAPMPGSDARFNGLGHWPEFREAKNKCRLCKTGYSRVYCIKCNLCLCLSNTRNCFAGFHKK